MQGELEAAALDLFDQFIPRHPLEQIRCLFYLDQILTQRFHPLQVRLHLESRRLTGKGVMAFTGLGFVAGRHKGATSINSSHGQRAGLAGVPQQLGEDV